MNINDLTIRQEKEGSSGSGLNDMVGKKVIIRTYSAGCWFGFLHKKSGNEVILSEARRMHFWKAKKGISLSACALYGVTDESRIVDAVESVWLEAIEIIPCSVDAIESLEKIESIKQK